MTRIKSSGLTRSAVVFALFGVAASSGRAEGSRQVQLIVNLPRTTPPGAAIYATGSTRELCSWNPDCIKLAPLGGHAVGTALSVPNGVTGVNVKITRGSYDNEASDGSGHALANIALDLTSGNPTVIDVAQWKDLGPLGVTGRIDQFPNFYSPQLQISQNISVWVPPGYGNDPNHRYPVIYMHDGQNVFDPTRATYGVDWSVDEVMTELVFSGKVPPALVVAVDHGPDRMSEYTWSQNGKAYGDFLVDTVKPFIDSHYRTLSDRAHTLLMGSSMGAVISFSLIWIRSNVFGAAAGLSMTAGLQNNEAFNELNLYPAPKNPVRFYMDCGNAGADASFAQATDQFALLLSSRGWTAPSYTYQIIPYADHTESNWAARVDAPLQFLLSGL